MTSFQDGLVPVGLEDRRSGHERRRPGLVPEPLERAGRERRAEERRDSPRVPRRLWVKDPLEGGTFQVFDGELGLGGASWVTRWPPLGEELEVRFRVPAYGPEVQAQARILRTLKLGEDTLVQAEFLQMPLPAELELARELTDEPLLPLGA